MPDVKTSCPVTGCDLAFETKRGLATHLTRTHPTYKASQLVKALASPTARPLPCTFPGCAWGGRTARGLAIHQRLVGHDRIVDSVEAGDGERREPAHPAYRSKLDGAAVTEPRRPGRRRNVTPAKSN